MNADDRARAVRNWRRAVFAVATAALLAAVGFAVARFARPHPLNVLMIVMDTTRADRCTIDGYARPTTPRLAEYARQGVLYRDAWSSANWTGPAHASLFTGLLPEHHGFHHGSRPYLPLGADTLAKRLADSGYATACFSNNLSVSPETQLNQGFETFVPFYERRVRTPPWARETHEEAATWARTQFRDGKPFFLFINDMEAHLPYSPPESVAAQFIRGSPTKEQRDAAGKYGFPRFLGYDLGVDDVTDAEWRLLSDLYDAEVATLDEEIGGLLDVLKEEGILDRTLVVVTADHGENLGDHHLSEHSFGMHRSLLHVPLLLRMPGKFDGGRVVDDVVRIEDVYPTVLEACGVAAPSGLDGVPLTRGLSGRTAVATQPTRDEYAPMIKERFPKADATKLLRAVDSAYDGRFHLLRYSDGVEELYDVKSDPDESRDLAKSSPDVAAKLRALMPRQPR